MAKKQKKKAKARRPNSKAGTSSSSDLALRQADWDASEARSFGAPLPDDEYEGIIENAVIETSRNGRLQVRWDLLVTTGPCEGRQCRKYSGLETKENMDWLKGDLETLDLQIPEEIENLGDTLEAACGMGIRFQVRSRDEYTNVDFIEPLEEGQNTDSNEDDNEGAAPELSKADIRKLGRAADKDDDDAIQQLEALAKDEGLDPDDYSWAELAQEIIDGM